MNGWKKELAKYVVPPLAIALLGYFGIAQPQAKTSDDVTHQLIECYQTLAEERDHGSEPKHRAAAPSLARAVFRFCLRRRG